MKDSSSQIKTRELKGGLKRKETPDPRDWQFSDHPAAKMPVKSKASIKEGFPPVYYQGQVGCCTSCAVLACDAYYYHKPKWIPSFIFTFYNQRAKVGNLDPDDKSGSSIELALKMVRKYGVCNSKIWSNDNPSWIKPSDEAYKDGLKGHEITTFHAVKDLDQLKQAISAGYPVAVSVVWAFERYDENYVMNDVTKAEAKKCDYGHAIVAVGYDDATGLIEFRNSWSKEWGNDGYAFMTYQTFKNVLWNDDTYAVVK